MRVKGSKDKKKRKVKTILNGTQERNLIADYEQGATTSELREKYNVAKSYISNMFKLRNIKPRIYLSIIKNWNTINISDIKEDISGVYGIYFVDKKNHNNIRVYIGSSINIKNRLNEHYRNLQNNRHYSEMLSGYFNDQNYSLGWAIIEKCPEELLLQRETWHLHNYNRSCLLNTWKPNKEEYIRAWLEKAITHDSYDKNYTINSLTGCKESTCVNKKGYGAMKVTIGESRNSGQRKYFYKHRVAYWEKYGEYPELVRHKCNNSKCYNADHLEKGSHKENSLDKRGNFPQIFESKWLEFKGDLEQLTKHFSDRWNGTQYWDGKKVSYSVYDWEKKLSLRKKYPWVLDANNKRRFSLSYQKLGRRKKKKQIGSTSKV
jgi:hypothetical protein